MYIYYSEYNLRISEDNYLEDDGRDVERRGLRKGRGNRDGIWE